MQAPPNLHRGIAIGIPSNGRGVPVEFAVALATQAWPLNVTLHYIHSKGLEVGEARNAIIKEALKSKVKYIWFLDDDTVPPPDACRKLVYELELSDAAACGGIYVDKQTPPSPLVFKEWGTGPFLDWHKDEVFQVAGIATGCLLVKAEVFERLPEPWFKTVSEPSPEPGVNRLTMTDDMFFCQKLEEAGYRVLAHGGVLCEHHDLVSGKVYTVPQRILDR